MQSSTKQKWSTIIAEQQASQLTVAAFCRQAHISPSTFYQRKREINGKSVNPTFVKATMTKSIEIEQGNEPITLFTGQMKIAFPLTIKAEYLATLIRGLNT